jgi:hypothetical protein
MRIVAVFIVSVVFSIETAVIPPISLYSERVSALAITFRAVGAETGVFT